MLTVWVETVNTESVFILLAIAAHEKKHLRVIDVKGAYLNADMSRPHLYFIYLTPRKDLIIGLPDIR